MKNFLCAYIVKFSLHELRKPFSPLNFPWEAAGCILASRRTTSHGGETQKGVASFLASRFRWRSKAQRLLQEPVKMQFSKVRLNWSQTTSKFLKPCVLLARDIRFVCSAHQQPGRTPSSCVLTGHAQLHTQGKGKPDLHIQNSSIQRDHESLPYPLCTMVLSSSISDLATQNAASRWFSLTHTALNPTESLRAPDYCWWTFKI